MQELKEIVTEIYKKGKDKGYTREEIFNKIRHLPEYSTIHLTTLLKSFGG